jgi:flavodoxin
MKIGIVIHSYSGNTLSVGEKIKEKLLALNHSVEILKINAVNENPNKYNPNMTLIDKPDLSSYDFIIFGAMVVGFNLSPVMKIYLKDINSISGKKVSCFLTEGFPFKWMGGTHSLKQFSELLKSKGAEIINTDIVNWMSSKRDSRINEVAEKLVKI